MQTNQKEDLEYIQGQMDKIRNSVKDTWSKTAWQRVIEVIRRKCISRKKLKATGLEERL